MNHKTPPPGIDAMPSATADGPTINHGPIPDLPPTPKRGPTGMTGEEWEAVQAKGKATREAHAAWRDTRTLMLTDGSTIRPDSVGTSTGQGAGWILEAVGRRPRYYSDPRAAYVAWAHDTGCSIPRPEYLAEWAEEWPPCRQVGKCGSLTPQEIATMRAAGQTLLEISVVAGVSEQAVKSFCFSYRIVSTHGGERHIGKGAKLLPGQPEATDAPKD